MAEKILVNYKHKTTYDSNEYNVIGATTDTTLRTVTAHNDANCKYVKKFGTDYAIGNITNAVISNPRSAGGAEWTYTFYGWNGSAWVSMGSVQDSGGISQPFSDGAAFSASKVKIVLSRDNLSYTITDGDDIVLTTDIDAGGLSVYLSGETGTTDLTWYLSSTGSTYYDENYIYGGYRHVADGTEQFPYFTISEAIVNMDTYNYICTVLDSETYDEEIEIDGAYTLQAALGETPTITSGIGARITREVAHDGNNSDTAYVGKIGSDITGTGTYQNPYLTHQYAFNNKGARTYINTIDSATYDENIVASGINLEPIYGKIPILKATTTANVALTITGSSYIKGYIIQSSLKGIYISASTAGASEIIKNCIFCYNGYGIQLDLSNFSGIIIKCIFYNNSYGIYNSGFSNFSGTISKCIYYNNTQGMYIAGITTFSGTIINCICYNNTYGIHIGFSGTFSGTVINCTCYNNTYGLHITFTVFSGTVTKCICYNNITLDLYSSGGSTITYSCYGTNSGFTIGAGCFTTDPQFCWTTLPYKLGISANSPCLKTDGSAGDIGAILRNLLITSDDVVINGFNFDGLEQYNNAIGKTGAGTNYDSTVIKWCSIYDYQGIAIDEWLETDDCNSQILNCKIYYNGNGIKFYTDGNLIQECLIYYNFIFGIHSNYMNNIFNHLILYNNQYGVYLESNSANILIKNSIFNQNSLYGIYSEVTISVTYCCITDAVNSYVDISDLTNVINNPLFIDYTYGSEDFHIKSKLQGYLFDSPCVEAADDGYDIGAYLIDYFIDDDSWRKYEFEFNPPHVDFLLNGKDYLKFEDALGNTDHFSKGHRRSFEFNFDNKQISSEELRQKLEYFTTLIQTRENNLNSEGTKFRLHLLPEAKLLSGTAIIDATNKTLTDSTKNKTENMYKGFWVGIIFESGVDLIIDHTTNTAQKVGAGWTVDEWIGYYFYHNGYYYYIKSNTADTLTLSNPDDTLVSETVDYTIEKYFRISENYKDEFTLVDDDDELIAGTYAYYIDFILCRVVNNKFKYNQPIFFMPTEHNKTNYSIEFEEITK